MRTNVFHPAKILAACLPPPLVETFESTLFSDDGPQNLGERLKGFKFWQIQASGTSIGSGKTARIAHRQELATRRQDWNNFDATGRHDRDRRDKAEELSSLLGRRFQQSFHQEANGWRGGAEAPAQSCTSLSANSSHGNKCLRSTFTSCETNPTIELATDKNGSR